MNTNRKQTETSLASILNGFVTGAFTLALIGMAGILTFAQFTTLA